MFKFIALSGFSGLFALWLSNIIKSFKLVNKFNKKHNTTFAYEMGKTQIPDSIIYKDIKALKSHKKKFLFKWSGAIILYIIIIFITGILTHWPK